MMVSVASVYSPFRREFDVWPRLAYRVRISWFCFRMKNYISFSVFRLSGKKTGQLRFSLFFSPLQFLTAPPSALLIASHYRASGSLSWGWKASQRGVSPCWIPSGAVLLVFVPVVCLLCSSSPGGCPTGAGGLEAFHPAICYYT